MLKIFLCMAVLPVLRKVASEKARIVLTSNRLKKLADVDETSQFETSQSIVGSGIGGSSCSYFLRDRLRDDIDIDLYEANEIGGRLATVEYEDQMYEVGGCIIHERNKYMNTFREKFALKKTADDSDEILAIRDSDGFKFYSSKSAIITYARMIWEYGFMSLYRLHKFISHLLDQFDNIYKLQETGHAFTTVEELFAAADPKFLAYFNISAKEGFCTHVHLNEKTVDDLVRATVRVNYGQTTNVHLFLSSVSVAGMFGSLWGIRGGNRQVPELLVQISGAHFLNNRVVKIAFDEQNRKYVVESVSKSTDDKVIKSYDVVVIANPITDDSKTPIEFANFSSPISVAGRYQRTVATLVAGNLNASYYHWYKDNVPEIIINNDDPVVNSIGKIRSVIKVKKVKTNVWKIFSQRPLMDEELKAMFESPKVIDIKDWLAYPKYEKLDVLDGNFVLHDRLFYVNAIEWAASAMEMSVIGGKNVALLVEKELRPQGKSKGPRARARMRSRSTRHIFAASRDKMPKKMSEKEEL